MKVAIQGGAASFHDMAARQYFAGEQLDLLECTSFRELCRALARDKVDRALMAIENTLVGTILPNYALLREYPLTITGEVYLHISHHLMALPGQQISDIKRVRSHPMALLQCSEFLDRYPHLRVVEGSDTADSARDIRQQEQAGTAAIASRLAAGIYKLDILAEHVENLQHNYTRFLVLSGSNLESVAADKASLSFRVHNKVGALAEALDLLRQHQINLTLIQSVALPDHPHEYAIHVDLEWQDEALFRAALQQLELLARRVNILGIYKRGVRPYDRATGNQA